MGNDFSAKKDASKRVKKTNSRIIRKKSALNSLRIGKRGTGIKKRGRKARKDSFMEKQKGNARQSSEDSQAVASIGIAWLKEQRKELENTDSRLLRTKFEEVFTKLAKRVEVVSSSRREKRQTVDKTVFLATCCNLFGDHIDTFMFQKLFDFMDSDKNGVVDEVEFSITVCFLLKHDVQSNTELAYMIFDSNRSGGLTKQEFSEMLAAIIGTTLKTVDHISSVRQSFDEFVIARSMKDSLSFYRKMKPYTYYEDDNLKFYPIPFGVVDQIKKHFLLESSVDKINVSSTCIEEILEAIDSSKGTEETCMEGEAFRECYEEVVYLIESNSLNEFKDALRKPPYTKTTKEVWKRFKLGEKDSLNFDQFSEWTSEIPGVFDFFKDIQKDMAGLIKKLEEEQLE